jgi:hypothetical protein
LIGIHSSERTATGGELFLAAGSRSVPVLRTLVSRLALVSTLTRRSACRDDAAEHNGREHHATERSHQTTHV